MTLQLSGKVHRLNAHDAFQPIDISGLSFPSIMGATTNGLSLAAAGIAVVFMAQSLARRGAKAQLEKNLK
jgi:hypothetical protein